MTSKDALEQELQATIEQKMREYDDLQNQFQIVEEDRNDYQ